MSVVSSLNSLHPEIYMYYMKFQGTLKLEKMKDASLA